MKTHFQLAFSYFYVPTSQGIKITYIYDDLDESFVCYNIHSIKKTTQRMIDSEFLVDSLLHEKNITSDNFYNDFFK